jgi:tetratricopeptide (TPR) repeat protein
MSHSTASGVFSQLDVPPAAIAAYRAGKAAAGQQQYNEAIEHLSRAISFAGAPAIFRARTYEQRGECLLLLGKSDEAKRDFEASLSASDDRAQIARSRARLGDVAEWRGHWPEAISNYTESLREGMAAHDLLAIGRAHRGLGVVNRRQANMEKALNHLTQALAAFRQAGDVREQGRVLTTIGETRHDQGEYQSAILAHSEALTILESIKDRRRAIVALNSLGACHQALYDLERAIEHHRRALRLTEEYVTGPDSIKPDIQRNLGMDLVEIGRPDEGQRQLEAALAGARQSGQREQEALALYHLARAHLVAGRTDAASQILDELGALAEALAADRFRALAAFAQGELLLGRGDRPAAVSALNEAMLAAQSAMDRSVLWKLHAAMSHVVDDPAIARVHAQIAADFIRQTAEPLQDFRLKAGFVQAAPVAAVLRAAGIEPDKLLRAS